LNIDDTFSLDLADYERPYIEEVLDTFVEDAGSYGRKVLEIRMSKAMYQRLEIDTCPPGGSFKGVPIALFENDYEGTIEVILGPLR
jgi:hypothetical protein